MLVFSIVKFILYITDASCVLARVLCYVFVVASITEFSSSPALCVCVCVCVCVCACVVRVIVLRARRCSVSFWC